MDGLDELAKFVQEGGALIGDGSSGAFLAEYGLAGTVTVEHPAQLFARGSILRGTINDLKSPIAYGFDGKELPIYFSQDPVFSAGGGFGGFGGGAGGPANAGTGQNLTPNAGPPQSSPWGAAAAPQAPPRQP